MGHSINPYLDNLLGKFKEYLLVRSQVVEPESFHCVSMLAKAVGPALADYTHDILDLMFETELNEPLRQALIDMSLYIPQLLSNIQGK